MVAFGCNYTIFGMKITLLTERQRARASAWVLPLFENEKPKGRHVWQQLGQPNRRIVDPYFSHDFHAKDNEERLIILPKPPRQLILLGLGKKNVWTLRKLTLLSRRIVRAAKRHRASSLAFHLDDLAVPGIGLPRAAQTVVENLLLADFEFTQYKERPKEGWPKVNSVELITGASREVRDAVAMGKIIGEETNECRRLANTPGSDMTPERLAREAQSQGHGRVRVRILNEAALRKLKMGGILGVSRGSDNRPRFIVMEYRGARRGAAARKPIVLVGKGVTFDSGGLNLKPEQSMQDMHMDMSGAAAVIHGIAAIARLNLPINVVGLIPAVENMPGSAGFRPGDLLKTMSGKTIEVLNTDAEGRIILADALTYAKRYDPSLVLDVATLTGAAMVALGQRATALFATNPKLEATLREVGEVSGDYVWPLPLWSEYEEDIKATFGDVANLGKSRWGGAITAAAFLWQFAKEFPQWAHLDIAPTMTTIEGQELSKGASGVGVRLLVELCRRLAPARRRGGPKR